jgi:hypothetical protein
MADPLYFRQYNPKRWEHLSEAEKALCIDAVDATLGEAGQRRKYPNPRPTGVAALPNGGFTYMWAAVPNDKA